MSGSRVADVDEALPTSMTGAVTPAVNDAALPFRISLAILFFAYWCVDIVSPALPSIQESLHLSATGAGLVFSVFFAGRLIANLPAAWMVERIGPKWTAVAGSGALLAGSMMAAAATSQAMLLPARGLQGVGVAVLATAGLLSILRARPGGGAAMTAFNVTASAGGSGGLLSGGLLTAEFGFRAVFLLSSLLSGVLLVGSLLARTRERLARIVSAEREESSSTFQSSRAGVAGAIAGNLLVFVNYSIWIVSMPLLGASKFGFNAEQVGLMLLFVNLVHLGSAFPVGGVIRKAGARWALAVGFGIGGAGMLLVPHVSGASLLAVPIALYAVGQVAGNSSAGDLILRLGGGGGRAVGAVRLSSDVGLVAGPAAAGALADVAGVEAPFVVLGVVALVAMALTVAIGFPGARRWSRAAG